VRRGCGRHKSYSGEVERIAYFLGNAQMGKMYRVEGPAENTDFHTTPFLSFWFLVLSFFVLRFPSHFSLLLPFACLFYSLT
jgi:hypothetical protein